MAKKSSKNSRNSKKSKKSPKQRDIGKCSLHSLTKNPEMSRDALAAHRSLVREIQNITETIKGIDTELSFMAQAVFEALKTRMSLREMAKRMDVSPTHLCHVSKRKTPCSWSLYKRLVDLMSLELHTCPANASANASGK